MVRTWASRGLLRGVFHARTKGDLMGRTSGILEMTIPDLIAVLQLKALSRFHFRQV